MRLVALGAFWPSGTGYREAPGSVLIRLMGLGAF